MVHVFGLCGACGSCVRLCVRAAHCQLGRGRVKQLLARQAQRRLRRVTRSKHVYA